MTAPGSTSSLHDRAFGTSGWGPSATALRQKPQQASLASSSQPADVHIGPVSTADRQQQQSAPASTPAFIKAKVFSGPKGGYIFHKGLQGVGYYLGTANDTVSAGKQQKKKQSKGSQGKSAAAEQQQQQEHQQPKEGVRESADSDEDMQPVKGLCNAFSMFVHASVH